MGERSSEWWPWPSLRRASSCASTARVSLLAPRRSAPPPSGFILLADFIFLFFFWLAIRGPFYMWSPGEQRFFESVKSTVTRQRLRF